MPPFKPKILMVDDEELARGAMAESLRARGYEVLELGTGKEVFAKAKESWPALIILDIVLPDISGIEVLHQLRNDPITKAIPVLLLTGKPGVVSQIPSFQESDRYFEKPGRVEELLKLVHDMLTGGKKS